MGTKKNFLDAFDATLPEGVADFAAVGLDFSGAVMPTTEEEAVIEMGKLAARWNAILDQFAGYTPVDTLLHIGQRNRVNRVAMLSGLEATQVTGDFRIVSPAEGSSYFGFFGVREGEWFAAQIVRGTATAISVALGEDTFDLEEADGVWQAEWPTPLGQHAATFTVTYATGKTAEKTVNFSVMSYPVTPPDGATVPLNEEFEITVDTQGDEVVSASVEIKNADTGEVIYTSTMAAIDNYIMGCIAKFGELPGDIPGVGAWVAGVVTMLSLQLANMAGTLEQSLHYNVGDPA